MKYVVKAAGASAISGACIAAAMLLYPGGTPLDKSTEGYAFFHNFLSDLGMFVSYNGGNNTAGAVLFIASPALLLAGYAGSMTAWLRFFWTGPRTRFWAGAAAAAAVFVVVAFAGVALISEDRDMALHVAFTLAGWKAFPALTLFLAIAALRAPGIPRRSAAGWIVLTVILLSYVVVLEAGPSLHWTAGLAIQVVAQKVTTLATVLVMVFQSREADRVLQRT